MLYDASKILKSQLDDKMHSEEVVAIQALNLLQSCDSIYLKSIIYDVNDVPSSLNTLETVIQYRITDLLSNLALKTQGYGFLKEASAGIFKSDNLITFMKYKFKCLSKQEQESLNIKEQFLAKAFSQGKSLSPNEEMVLLHLYLNIEQNMIDMYSELESIVYRLFVINLELNELYVDLLLIKKLEIDECGIVITNFLKDSDFQMLREEILSLQKKYKLEFTEETLNGLDLNNRVNEIFTI